uniref:Reverse transcriptase Ty1/copia-type domain-containing protein n=1 Tax=Solanum lycopersicum TaxID=4081 RepID=A0A3Q7HMD9_SOLLC
MMRNMFWNIKMKTLFMSQDFWDLIEDGFTDVAELNAGEKRRLKEIIKKDSKSMFFIQQVIHKTIFSRILAATTSRYAWLILKTELQGSSKVITVKRQSLRRDFETLFMNNNESVQGFLSRVSGIEFDETKKRRIWLGDNKEIQVKGEGTIAVQTRQGSSYSLVCDFKSSMMRTIEMTYLEVLNYFLGLEVKKEEDGIFISQRKYATDLLKRFNMLNCKIVSTPTNVNEKLQLDNDSDWTGNVNDRKSISGNLFTLGSATITWNSKKQSTTTLSSSKAKYVVATSSTYQVLSLRKLLDDLHQEQKGSTKIFYTITLCYALTYVITNQGGC